MDPNANLEEQAQILDLDPSPLDRAADERRLTKLRRALSGWLAHSGFAPDWIAYPKATKAYKSWLLRQKRIVGYELTIPQIDCLYRAAGVRTVDVVVRTP